MSSFDRWMRNQQQKEASNRLNWKLVEIAQECMEGNYSRIPTLSAFWNDYSVPMMLSKRLNVTTYIIEHLYESWVKDSGTAK